jgi:hypothetical protein
MMVIIFATMFLALASARYTPRWIGIVLLLACLVLSTGLFLFEIYNPEYGFRMPWLQVRLNNPLSLLRSFA